MDLSGFGKMCVSSASVLALAALTGCGSDNNTTTTPAAASERERYTQQLPRSRARRVADNNADNNGRAQMRRAAGAGSGVAIDDSDGCRYHDASGPQPTSADVVDRTGSIVVASNRALNNQRRTATLCTPQRPT